MSIIKNKKKILIIGFPNSVHLNNWINSISLKNNDLYFFPSSRGLCTYKKELQRYQDHFYTSILDRIYTYIKSFFEIKKAIFMPKIYIKQILNNKYILRKYIRYLDPDIIHCFELQHAGYLLFDSVNKMSLKNIKLILSNYGSDIFFFENFNFHKKKIDKVLKFFSVINCESRRDIALSRKYNKSAKFYNIPNSAGINFEINKLSPLKYRSNIIIKGYDGIFGRLMIILKYLKMLDKEIKYNFIYIYSVSLFSKLKIKLFYKKLPIIFIPRLAKEELLEYFKNSKLYIGSSVSDGISTSALDAISMKTFPLQSDTCTLNEIFYESKILYNIYDFRGFKSKIKYVFLNEKSAQNTINRIYSISKQLSISLIKKKINILYK